MDRLRSDSAWFVAFDIQADECAVLFIHVGNVSLRKVVYLSVFGLTPVIAPYINEACLLQRP